MISTGQRHSGFGAWSKRGLGWDFPRPAAAEQRPGLPGALSPPLHATSFSKARASLCGPCANKPSPRATSKYRRSGRQGLTRCLAGQPASSAHIPAGPPHPLRPTSGSQAGCRQKASTDDPSRSRGAGIPGRTKQVKLPSSKKTPKHLNTYFFLSTEIPKTSSFLNQSDLV